MQKIEIKLSKKKLVFLLLAGIGFIFFSLWFILSPSDFVNFLTRNEKIIFWIGIIGIIFFGLASIQLLIKLVDNKPGLIIDKDGIIDSTNSSSIGLIKWSDITEIVTKKVVSTRFLLVKVKNPEKYIAKANRVKKLSLRQNLNTHGTPLTLTSIGLQCSFEELEKVIKDTFLKYKNENN